jgi:peptide/nickel transport system substrate-binding protein
MRRREILKGAAASATMAATGLACPAVAEAEASTLHFVPQANLANPDPIWTTATVAINHGYMVFDTLYGIDAAVQSHPQMCAGHEISDDKLTWTFMLRDELVPRQREGACY